MLKPERVTFSADDDKFHQYTNNSDHLDSYLNQSLVHYSTDFQKRDSHEATSIKHSNSLDELSAVTMASQQQPQQSEHEPPVSAPPILATEQLPTLTESNLQQFDALTLQQMALGSSLNGIHGTDAGSPSRSTSMADIQREVDRVRQMKYGRPYSSPSSSLCSRVTLNPFSGSNNSIDLSTMTHSVQFSEPFNSMNRRLPFSSTYITSIPESIVPAAAPSSTEENRFIPIHQNDSSSLEDREVFETFHTKSPSIPGIAKRQPVPSLNRNMSASETDLLASLHRSASKQGLDTQSEHGTTLSGTSDEMIFVEWDKERNLFQDYINSLRTEIRVLLQERSEYQKQMETINQNLSEHERLNSTQVNDEQSKLQLLQKSLEEKNFVLEHLQKEYENLKEKNGNLTRKISDLRCDGKAQTGVIDELKQKIAELTVDIQNHALIKRRLEISLSNLESDCRLIDAERVRLTTDVKDIHLSKQDLEKLLQQANVQIAEQGSTIEMLRSDNIQVRSQLSTTQRRMLQEKQQIMDYLRQIETDLVEKEQLKQRESILRRDVEQLQSMHKQDRQDIDRLQHQINQDQQKLAQLEQGRLELLKTIQQTNDSKGQVEQELDVYRSAAKRLYTHLKVPFDSIQSMDQLIPMLEGRYRTEQISQARIHEVPLVRSTPDMNNDRETEELRQLRQDLSSMTVQVKQLDEANQAWQQYQQNQLSLLRDRLKLSDIDHLSFDDVVQQLEDRFNELHHQLIELQEVKESEATIDTLQRDIDELRATNQQLMTRASLTSNETQTEETKSEPLPLHVETEQALLQNAAKSSQEDELREALAALTVQCSQLDEANRAWQLYQQTQVESLRRVLQTRVPIDDNLSFEDTTQQLVTYLDQVDVERESQTQRMQMLEKLNTDLLSDSASDIEDIKQSYVDTINDINQQVIVLQQQKEQLEAEKAVLNQSLNSTTNSERTIPTSESTSSISRLFSTETRTTPLPEARIHTITPLHASPSQHDEHQQELQQLRQQIVALTDQSAQLEAANQAWQLYQQTQLGTFMNKLQGHLMLDGATSLDQAAEQVLEQINTERQHYAQQYQTLEQLQQQFAVLTAQHDDDLRALQQIQVATLRQHLRAHLPIDTDDHIKDQSIEDFAQLIVDQITRERDQFQTESAAAMESLQQAQAQADTVEEVKDELRRMQEQCEQMRDENEQLQTELQQRRVVQSEESSGTVAALWSKSAFEEVPIHTTNGSTDEDEVGRLREQVVVLTDQCAQLEAANRAWQSYHETQVASFRRKMGEHMLVDENVSLEGLGDQLIDEKRKEREEFSQHLAQLQSESAVQLDSMQNLHSNTLHEFSQKLLTLEQQREQSNVENETLKAELEKVSVELNQRNAQRSIETVSPVMATRSLDQVPIHEIIPDATVEIQQLRQQVIALTDQLAQLEAANQAWQLYQQTQLGTFVNKLHPHFSFDNTTSFDQLADRILEQINVEREENTNRSESLDRSADQLRAESATTMATMRQSYSEAIDGLNQELVSLKQMYELLGAENQNLKIQVDSKNTIADRSQAIHRIESPSLDRLREVSLHTSASPIDPSNEELLALRESVAALTIQCAQLNEANYAWQQFHQSQLAAFQTTLQGWLPLENVSSLDQIAQVIIAQLSRHSAVSKEDQDTQTIESPDPVFIEQQQELSQLRSDLTTLTVQCNQMQEETRSRTDAEREHIDLLKVLFPSSNQTTLVDMIQETVAHVHHLTQEQAAEKEKEHQLVQELQSLRQQLAEAKPSLDEQESQTEDDEIEEKLMLLENQYTELDQANRSWQSFYDTQLNMMKNQFRTYLPSDEELTFEQMIQSIGAQLAEQQQHIDDNQLVESNREELELLKQQLADSQNHEQLLRRQIETLQEESRALEQQLEEHQYSIESLKNTLQLMSNDNEVLKQEQNEYQQKNESLTHENFNLSQRLNELETLSLSFAPQYGNLSPSLVDSAQTTTQKQASATLVDDVPIHTVTPLQSASSLNVPSEREEEVQRLRDDLVRLTEQHAQLEEANRAWHQYHQTQLEIFRHQLKDWIPFDEHTSLEQMAQNIVNQFDQLATSYETDKQLGASAIPQLPVDNSFNVSAQAVNFEELNKKSLDIQQQCDEFREHNSQLILSHQQLEQQLAERDYQLSQLQTANNQTEQLVYLQQHNESLQQENQVLQRALVDLEQGMNKTSLVSSIQRIDSPRENVAIHNLDHVRDEEMRQLRADLAAASTHCSQLEEANRAWQQYQHDQVEAFRRRLQPEVPALEQTENASLDSMAPQILNQLNELHVERGNLRRQMNFLEEEVQAQKQKLDRPASMESEKRTISRASQEKQLREARIHSITPVQASAPSPSLVDQHQQELQQLRQQIVALTDQLAQLEAANQAWQLYQQTQLGTFVNKLQGSFSLDDAASFDQLADQILEQTNAERQHFAQQYQALEQFSQEQTKSTVPLSVATVAQAEEVQHLQQQLAVLTTQHDDDLRALQQIQLSTLRQHLRAHLPIDTDDHIEDQSIEDFAQLIVDQITRERDQFQTESAAAMESLQQAQAQADTVEEVKDELRRMQEQCEQMRDENEQLQTELEQRRVVQSEESSGTVAALWSKSAFEEVPIHTTNGSTDEDEVGRLREQVVVLTDQCAQLEAANRAWQSYHEAQVASFRRKMGEHMLVDENVSLEGLGDQLIDELNKERHQSSQRLSQLESELRNEADSASDSSADKVRELNEELVSLRVQYEELERTNEEYLRDKETSETRAQYVDAKVGNDDDVAQDDKLAISGILATLAAESKEELDRTRTELSQLTVQVAEASQAHEVELKAFRDQLQNWLTFSDDSTLDEIAGQLNDHFIQQQQNIRQVADNQTQTIPPPETIHAATSTVPSIVEHRETQIESIEMIDEGMQTESLHQLWSSSKDELLLNSDGDDYLWSDYLVEISSLSPADLTERLKRECEQILSKQNVRTSAYPDLDLNQLALTAFYALYHQHIADDAKQLYNETMLRALRQECELISNEKNDYLEKCRLLEEQFQQQSNIHERSFGNLQNTHDDLLEQNELERINAKQSLSELADRYSAREKQWEFNLLTLHEENQKLRQELDQLKEHYDSLAEKDYEQLDAEYQQLRQDYSDVINQNELLKDINSKMYQEHLQGGEQDDAEPTKSFQDIDIQCNLSDEKEPTPTQDSEWNSDWNDEETSLPVVPEDEIKRLRDLVEEIQRENENLKDWNSQMYQAKYQEPSHMTHDEQDRVASHDIDIQCTIEPVSIDEYSQTEIEVETHHAVPTVIEEEVTSTTETDDQNAWGDQLSPLELPSEESGFSSLATTVTSKQTADNETQTDEPVPDKSTQLTNKLKRALQTVKEKVHQAVVEQPEIFESVSDDTMERLDHLILTFGDQATQIASLQNDRDHVQQRSDEVQSSLHAYQSQLENVRPITAEPVASTRTPPDDDALHQQIEQLQTKLSQNEDERALLRERLDEVELEFRKTLDDRSSTLAIYDEQLQSLVQERNALLEQRALDSSEGQQLDELKQRYAELSSQLQSLISERDAPLERLQTRASTDSPVPDHEKLVKVNNKLKRVVHTFKEKIQQVVTERPELFADVGEETSERLDHLLSTVQEQASYIVVLQSEREQTEEQLRRENQNLQNSLEMYQQQQPLEAPIKEVALVSATAPHTDESHSNSETNNHEIHRLQQKLSQNEDERALLRERLDEVELEFGKLLEGRALTLTMYEEQLQSLVQERNALVEQHILESTENQNLVEKLREEIAQLQSSTETQPDHSSSDSNTIAMKEALERQSTELDTLRAECLRLSAQQDSYTAAQTELETERQVMEERLHNFGSQMALLTRERDGLLERLGTRASTDSPAPDQDKLVKVNNKLKRVVHTFKEKIQQVVTQRPELFTDVGEETSERLDHLLSTVQEQASYIAVLQTERDQIETQLRHEIQELRSFPQVSNSTPVDEHLTITEESLATVPLAQSVNTISSSEVDGFHQQIQQLQKKLSQNDDERALLRERLDEVELEFGKLLEDRASTPAMYEVQLQSLVQERNALVEQHILESSEGQQHLQRLQQQLDELRQSSDSTNDIRSLQEIIQQQAQELRDITERYVDLSSQLESQTDADRQKREAEDQLREHQRQMELLTRERGALLEQLQTRASSDSPAPDHDKLTKVNNKLKRFVHTFKEKIQQAVTERPELFTGVGEETSERLDHLLSIVQQQATQIDVLQAEQEQSQQRFQAEVQELQRSFDTYRKDVSDHETTRSKPIVKVETRTEERIRQTPLVHASPSSDNQWNDWSSELPQIDEKTIDHQDVDIQCELLTDNDQSQMRSSPSVEKQQPTVTGRLFGFLKNVASPWSEQESSNNDWNDQSSPLQFSSEEPVSSMSTENIIAAIQTKLQQILSEHPDLFPHPTGDTLDDLNQLSRLINKYQDDIRRLSSSSELETSQKQIVELQEQLNATEITHRRAIDRLLEERNQVREQDSSRESSNHVDSQTGFDDERHARQSQIETLPREHVSLIDQINPLAQQGASHPAEDQANLSVSSDQRIPRLVFEQEILAWSKESEQLKQFVKQIQIENKKLTDIIQKLERMTQDYMHENERLKQENQHLSFLSYPNMESMDEIDAPVTSDTDICYLTLKCLTYEVAQRVSSNSESTLVVSDSNDPYLKQRFNETERQLKTVRIQNQRLKKQLENYTFQLKHNQHEMNGKNQELSALKIEIDKLRASETQYRLEVDRLKTDLQCDQVRFQQFERELGVLRLERNTTDPNSSDNLRELIELKERELKALKEKLDYTVQAHQLELQEAIKANQFSLDNVQRFEQLDQRHQEKQKTLEVRLGKICRLVKPLFDYQQFWDDDSIIDLHALQQLVSDTEAEEKVTTSLGSIRDCLGLLESQMKELHLNLMENHARRSKRWKYRVGFECVSAENQWDQPFDPQNLQEACQNPTLFLESSRTDSTSGCSCPITIDFVESDVLLCLDDLLDEVVVRTTVK